MEAEPWAPRQLPWGAISRGLAQYLMTYDILALNARSVKDLDPFASVFQPADDKPVPQRYSR